MISLPVQSNSAVAEFDMFSVEIGQARFRMEGRGGVFPRFERVKMKPHSSLPEDGEG